MTLIALSSVSKVYGEHDHAVRALDDVSLEVARGEMVAIIGASGSGKSTLLHVLGCLDAPSAGSYAFQGVAVEELDADRRALLRRHYFGFVFQSFHLLARASALENVELPLVYHAVPSAERKRRAREALVAVGLEDRMSHTPGQLSGGQQQRVAIARAMVSRPLVLFADEPTGNLDTKRRREIMGLLTRLHREQGLTILIVTHEPEIAEQTSRTITVADGRIVSDVLNEKPQVQEAV
jgi:putative ABC transport system ATP-binding protein